MKCTSIKAILALGIMALFCPLVSQVAKAVVPMAQEMAEARRWVAGKFENVPEAKAVSPFFSFTYGGKSSAELLNAWNLKRTIRQLDGQRTERTLAYTDPKTGLEVRCVAVVYSDYPTAEWTLYFKNAGTTDTPILSDVLPLDTRFSAGGSGRFLLHHWVGSVPADLQPQERVIKPNDELRFTPYGGRPTSTCLPNYNIETGGGGVIVVLGWPGQWASRFTSDAESGLRIRGGQELTRFQTPSRRRGPNAAGSRAVLQGRLDSRAEPLAAVDGQAQSAPAWRQASAADAGGGKHWHVRLLGHG